MAILRPFLALRPDPAVAERVAAVPYDVVNADEARALAAGNPFSFLHVSRAEIDLAPDVDPHADSVYLEAAQRYDALKREAPFVRDQVPLLYIYRLQANGRSQTGIAACFSLDEYDNGVIKRHERTRKDKEDDRTRHITELRAQTGPVFLLHKPDAAVTQRVAQVVNQSPLVDFQGIDGVRHTMWRVAVDVADLLVADFAGIDALYIADGHHRAASAARARAAMPGSVDAASFLAVAFPSDQVQILPYSRIVKDLAGRTPASLLSELARLGFAATNGPAAPAAKGSVSLYVGGAWHTLTLESSGATGQGVVETLDCNLLQDKVLTPVLGIGDIRTDPRIDFVGGARGTTELEALVNSGRAAAAFSMFPVGVQELMAVSDAGSIMPPKSTWFEPKLRDGLLIHEI